MIIVKYKYSITVKYSVNYLRFCKNSLQKGGLHTKRFTQKDDYSQKGLHKKRITHKKVYTKRGLLTLLS
ncbi:hypothetical protein Hanom_Chr10g00906561 [Helianthus anomalus]